jgi:hypothetical protein
VILASPVGRLLALLAVVGAAAIAYFGFIWDKGESSGRDSLFKPTNLARALGAVRAREGGAAPMIEVQVEPDWAEFQVAEGRRARFYHFDAKSRDMEYQGTLADQIRGHQFSLRRVSPDVAERLVRTVRRERGLETTVITLARDPVLRWTVAAEDEATAIVFTADPDGSGLRQFRRFSRRD